MNDQSEVYGISIDTHEPSVAYTLYKGVDNWIGYWFRDSQSLEQAFGDNFDKITSIKSEKWFYAPIPENPKGLGGISGTPSSKNRNLHFGRGYIVRISEDIKGFRWNSGGSMYKSKGLKSVTSFDVKDSDNYNVIDLINIDENIIEVGAYDDSLCVGAGVVVDGQAQILIYNNDESKVTQNIELVFIENDKKRKKVDELYKYDFDQDLRIELKDIVCDNEYMLLSLTNDYNESVNPPNTSIASVYPNPFNPETAIDFNINHESQVLMSIYNLKGQLVKRLINDKLSAGDHKVVWNGKNDNNKSVASGIYFCKMKTDTKVVTKKMMLMK